VLADPRQAGVQRQEAQPLAPRQVAVGGEDVGQQVLQQAHRLLGVGWRRQGRLEGLRVPARLQLAPAAFPAAGPQFLEEGRVPHGGPHRAGVLEELLAQVDRRDRRVRMHPAHMLDVATQDGGLHVLGPHHVVGHQQEPPLAQPVEARDHRGQFGQGPGLGHVLQQQVQHRHEVRFPGAETAVQVGGLAGPRLDRALDELQGLLEARGQLGGDHVAVQGLTGVRDTLGQPEDEVPLVDLVGDVEEVSDQDGHSRRCFARGGQLPVAGGEGWARARGGPVSAMMLRKCRMIMAETGTCPN
jgi:hypothetical protein